VLVGVGRLFCIIYSSVIGNTVTSYESVTLVQALDVYVSYYLMVTWIFMLFWVWDDGTPARNTYWTDIPPDQNGAWQTLPRFMVTAFGNVASIGYSKYLPNHAASEVLVALFTLLSAVLNLVVFGTAITIARRNSDRKGRAQRKLDDAQQLESIQVVESPPTRPRVSFASGPLPEHLVATPPRYTQSSSQQQQQPNGPSLTTSAYGPHHHAHQQ
jgi:hypothetical protein